VELREGDDEALAAAEARFEAERRASQEATSRVIEEAERLVDKSRTDALRDREVALAELQAQHKAAIDKLFAQAYDGQAALSADRDRALQAAETQRQQLAAELGAKIAQLKEDVVAAERSADRAREDARMLVAQSQAELSGEAERRVRDLEAASTERVTALLADNEKAAGIISNLLRETDEARRQASELAGALRAAEESSRKELADFIDLD
jgi:hypothetical protein